MGCWTISRRSPTLTAVHIWAFIEIAFEAVCDSSLQCDCFGLLDEAVAHSEGGKSSRTSGWSICAITGCAFILNDLRNFQHKGIGVIY